MHRIVISGKLSSMALDMLRNEPDTEVDYQPDVPMVRLMEIIGDADCLISRSETPIERPLLDRAHRLKVIGRAAVGVGNIDVAYATERGILVMNTPGMNTNSAAELTLGLLLACARKIIPAHRTMEQLGWDRHRFSGMELRGKTIGIIGLGNVGHRVARFAHGFQMEVLAYDPYLAPAIFEQHKATAVSLEDLCRLSDIITVHVPKTPETTRMIHQDLIQRMKPGVILLNAARGGIIDEAALLHGLLSGKVGAAGIDTWETEPPRENPLRSLPNVVMTPHIGASTEEAQQAVGISIAQQTIRALRGEVVDFPVNMPQMKILEGSLTRKYTVLSEKLGSFAAQFIQFTASRLEVLYRGSLNENEVTLSRLSFLRGFLQHTTDDLVTYVNAERKASARGLQVDIAPDLESTDYESSIRFVLTGPQGRLQIAGVVFGGTHIRITRINDFLFEMEPAGRFLVTTNRDRPGMIGVIGTVLGDHRVNIDQFELGRNRKGGEAMALIRMDSDAPESAVQELKRHPGIICVSQIRV